MKPESSIRGFTLLELLVTLLILGTVMSVIMACFDGGFRVYERISRFGNVELNVYLAGEQVQQDLAVPMNFRDAVFASDRMEFKQLVDSGEIDVAYKTSETGKNGGLLRTQAGVAGEKTERSEALLGQDFRVAFQYAGTNRSEREGQGEWQDSWINTTNRPGAIRMQVRFGENGASEIVRTMPLRGE